MVAVTIQNIAGDIANAIIPRKIMAAVPKNIGIKTL